jgi:uncharacterized phiE125 gp8 family phage protein
MMYGLRVTVNPTSEPLNLDETKLYLRVDHSEDDALILSMIAAARQYCEAVTKRSFTTQTMQMWSDQFPDTDTIDVPRPFYTTTDLTVKYYLSGSTSATTFAASNYWVDDSVEPGRIVLRDAAEWPTSDLRSAKGVEVTFRSGYGGEPDVPDGIKMAMLSLIGHWYTNREAVVVGTISSSIEMAVHALLSPHMSPFVA